MAKAKKAATKRVTKKASRVEKTRNAGTMTESAFFSMIRSRLRKISMYWKPISIVKQKARRAYKGPNKRQKWEYQCSQCKQWWMDKQVAVHHIVECGSLKSFADLPGFAERLFVEEDGLCLLCQTCHSLQHKK